MVKELLPQDDLYNYINLEWLNKTTIPDDETSWGTFSILRQKNMKILNKIIKNSKNLKLKILYDQGMNTKKLNELNNKPIQKYLKYIDEETNFTKLITSIHLIGIDPYFAIGNLADKDNSDYIRLDFSQSGLGLPNKLYYFDEDKKELRSQYRK